MVLRSLQGVLECTVSPTFMLITGAWYTSDEHTHRSIIWGTGNAGMSVLTNLICYGIAFRAQKNPSGPAPWRDISFFLGGLTMFLAVMVFFFLGTPREVSWFSEREKRMAAARVVRNKTGSDVRKDQSGSGTRFERPSVILRLTFCSSQSLLIRSQTVALRRLGIWSISRLALRLLRLC
jgi:MFS family permease